MCSVNSMTGLIGFLRVRRGTDDVLTAVSLSKVNVLCGTSALYYHRVSRFRSHITEIWETKAILRHGCIAIKPYENM